MMDGRIARKGLGAGVLLALSAVSGSAWGAEAATTEEMDSPNFGQHIETQEDLKIKVLGGYVRMKRTWVQGQWEFNRRWKGLSAGFSSGDKYAPGVSPEKPGTPEILIRNGSEYEENGDHFVPEKDPTKRIVPLENGGYRWEDTAGNWIRYNAERRAVAYGNSNDIQVTLERDNDGRLLHVLDHHGNRVLTFSYNTDDRLTLVEDRAGRTVRYAYTDTTYDHGPKLAEVTDVRGNTWSYEYSGDRLSAKTDPKGRTTELEYNPNGTLKGETTPGGFTVQTSYDHDPAEGAFVKREESPEGLVTETTYNKDGDLIRIRKNGELVREHRYGDRKKITIDAAGNRTVREYDEWDNLIRVTHPDGSSQRYEYRAGTDLRTREVDELGNVTRYEYDADGNRTRVVEAVGTEAERETSYEYDQYNRVTTVTRGGDAVAEDATIRLEYDQYGNVIRRTGPEGGVQKFSHNVLGQVTKRVDARGETWTKRYDAAGNLIEEADPLGNATTYEYDAVGNRIALTDPLGNSFSFEYNADDRRVAMTDPLGATIRLAYDRSGRLTNITDPSGVSQDLKYDSLGRLTKVIDGAGNATTYGYDQTHTGNPRLRSSTNYPTYAAKFSYDSRGRRTQTIKAEGSTLEQVIRKSFDAGGRVVAETDPKGRTTRFEYDPLGRLTKKIDPAGGVTRFAYDSHDNLLKVTNARGVAIRRFQYDLAGRRTAILWPDGDTVQYRYDNAGNLVEKINARGQAIRHTYDAAGRRVKSTYHTDPSASPDRTVAFTYDADGRMTGYSGSVTTGTYTYDSAGRRIGATVDYGDFTKSYSYTYYVNGKIKSFTAPDGTTYNYRYDDANRLKGIMIPGLGEITYHDYQWMRPTRIMRPGGGVEEHFFDRMMRLGKIRALDPAGNPLLDFEYTYDAAGNLTEKITEHGDYNYSYSSLDQLIQAKTPDPLPDEAYTYDAVGNRKTYSHTTGEWIYNESDQLVDYGEFEQEFDADGNLVQTTNTETGEVTKYQYNVAGRLASVKKDGEKIASYSYDPFGRRIKKKTVNGLKLYVYSKKGLIAETDGGGEVQKSYGYQPEGEWTTNPQFMKKSGNYFFYINDHSGVPQKLVDVKGGIVWSAKYGSFGERVASINEISNNLSFPGHYKDDETGLYYNFHRFYNSSTGRYLTRDPLRAGRNSYSYAEGNPVTGVDPLGLVTWKGSRVQVSVSWLYAGATGSIFDLWAAVCKDCEKKAEATVLAIGAGINSSRKVVELSGSNGVTLQDGLKCPDPDVLSGVYAELAAGVYAGRASAGASYLRLGGASKGVNFSISDGSNTESKSYDENDESGSVGAYATGYIGKSTIVDSNIESLDCCD
ncbi:RHS repeat-associated core domain-containing protein [Thiohalorhabdus denitrificans]|uniref:RHS repeat-associated core domain-containing protein n=1 Tax=Thiohalorhabdus denitrificans TaxID=381306 RepID=A0A1G5DV10_9GAMM|nr:RHS repeat-associated core domain-containing protein [Thiohalorhabdus denitrificans]SCY18586.1 RHS repeat-associated core domain-containing protein [Thiohalorhabdus denitrificans]